MWIAAAGVRLVGQDLRIDPERAAAIRVSVETLAQHVGNFSGLRVRVADAIVEKVVSPRVFILTGQRPVVGLNGRDRVGVIVESGSASVVANMPVVVIGAAGTFAGAESSGVLARTEALTSSEREAIRKHPLVLALEVETQGSVNLLRRPSPPPTATPAPPAVPPSPTTPPPVTVPPPVTGPPPATGPPIKQ
jgi:hypothetical protein